MTNWPPPGSRSSQREPLGFDDYIGIFVAFATIGTILFWSLSRREQGWNFTNLLPLSPTPNVSPNPSVTPIPTAPPQRDTSVELPSTQTPNPSVVPSPLESPDPESTVTSPSGREGTPGVGALPFIGEMLQNETPDVETSKPNETTLTPEEEWAVVTPAQKLPTIPPPIDFRDVPDNFWGRDFIDVLSSRNIIKGFEDYTYRPNEPVTRAQFAAILQQAFDKQIRQDKFAFQDIPEKFWAVQAINEAISSGFLKGYPDKIFKPDQRIPRVQVLVALVSGLDLKAPANPDKILSVYKDAKDIPNYAKEKIATATANGLVVNYPDVATFQPNKEATRAEVAAMVHQALVRLGRLQPTTSKNVVKFPK